MEFLNIINAIILGIIEGITEWLPISSTGHLILAENFFGFEGINPNIQEDFSNMFEVVIQLGAILAVVVVFWKKLWPIVLKDNKVTLKKNIMSLWGKVIIACLPAAVIGLLVDDLLTDYVFTKGLVENTVIAIALVVYGVAFIIMENIFKDRQSKIDNLKVLDWKTALFIGCFQVMSLIPGTSRSGVTILGALILGASRVAAAEFSFYLAIPVMFGASALKVYKYIDILQEKNIGFSGYRLILLATGMLMAFIVSVLAIKFLLAYIKNKDFKAFGWYRIIFGIVVLIFVYYPILK